MQDARCVIHFSHPETRIPYLESNLSEIFGRMGLTRPTPSYIFPALHLKKKDFR